MADMDSKTMIHIGTEILLIGGLGFWMKKRVDTLDSQVEELSKKLAAYENIITQQQQLLARHDSLLRQAFGVPDQKYLSGPERDVKNNPSNVSKNPETLATAPLLVATPKSLPKEAPESSKQEEMDITPDELDKILQAELSQPSDIEIETLESVEKQPLKRKTKVVSSRKKKST
jgi:hypothetical protein